MGWSIGYSEKHKRDIGYAVPAKCDHPGCDKIINRGLGYLCGDLNLNVSGCNLYFCEEHLKLIEFPDEEFGNIYLNSCERCASKQKPFEPSEDIRVWMEWKLKDESWEQWRQENPEQVKLMKEKLGE